MVALVAVFELNHVLYSLYSVITSANTWIDEDSKQIVIDHLKVEVDNGSSVIPQYT